MTDLKNFATHFFKLCKANFPHLTHVKKNFPDAKKKNVPSYYLDTIATLDPFLKKQLLVTFLLTLNFLGTPDVYAELQGKLPGEFLTL
jgi:hypothetical protein